MMMMVVMMVVVVLVMMMVMMIIWHLSLEGPVIVISRLLRPTPLIAGC